MLGTGRSEQDNRRDLSGQIILSPRNIMALASPAPGKCARRPAYRPAICPAMQRHHPACSRRCHSAAAITTSTGTLARLYRAVGVTPQEAASSEETGAPLRSVCVGLVGRGALWWGAVPGACTSASSGMLCGGRSSCPLVGCSGHLAVTCMCSAHQHSCRPPRACSCPACQQNAQPQQGPGHKAATLHPTPPTLRSVQGCEWAGSDGGGPGA